MTEELRRQAARMMDEDRETAGFSSKSNPAPNVTIPIADSEALDKAEAANLVSMTFMSRTDGKRPHVVSVDFSGMVTCICQSMTPCWATKAFCRVTGRPLYH